nr:hypothetical protein [Maliibacterium massiliense]
MPKRQQRTRKVLGVDVNILLGMSYFFPVLGIITIMTDKNCGTFVRFHVFQGIAVFLLVMLIGFITCGVGFIAYLLPIVLGIMMMCKKPVRIPGVAQLCDRLAQ